MMKRRMRGRKNRALCHKKLAPSLEGNYTGLRECRKSKCIWICFTKNRTGNISYKSLREGGEW